jgi:hypothetical protein
MAICNLVASRVQAALQGAYLQEMSQRRTFRFEDLSSPTTIDFSDYTLSDAEIQSIRVASDDARTVKFKEVALPE